MQARIDALDAKVRELEQQLAAARTGHDGGQAALLLPPATAHEAAPDPRVVRINPAGPLVKVELLTEWGESARAELTQDRYRAAPVACGEDVFVSAREASTKAS